MPKLCQMHSFHGFLQRKKRKKIKKISLAHAEGAREVMLGTVGQISIWTSARALPSSTNFYPEKCLWHFPKIAKFLSGQTYGISKNFANFYPVLDTAFEGIFQGPGLFPHRSSLKCKSNTIDFCGCTAIFILSRGTFETKSPCAFPRRQGPLVT